MLVAQEVVRPMGPPGLLPHLAHQVQTLFTSTQSGGPLAVPRVLMVVQRQRVLVAEAVEAVEAVELSPHLLAVMAVVLRLQRLLGAVEAPWVALLALLVELLVSMEPVAEAVEAVELSAPAVRVVVVVLVVQQEEAAAVVAAVAARVDQAPLAPLEKCAYGLGSCSSPVLWHPDEITSVKCRHSGFFAGGLATNLGLGGDGRIRTAE